jgi:iron complex outermembrane receptor protein
MLTRTIIVSTLAAAAALAGGQYATAADGPTADDATAIAEITVTARRRDESILETPVAIIAVTGEDLEAKGITSFNQLADSVPGINISNVSVGAGRNDRSFQQITLRGFVPSNSNSTLTATFIDGVPVASATAISSVSDPARVEILKGPQAAYFGRNTFAGAVNVVNRLPGDEFAGNVSLMAGTRSNLDFQAAFEGPLVSDKLGFRVNLHRFSKDGSYRNTANPGETLGDQSTTSVNLLLTLQATDNFSAKLFALYSEDDDGPHVTGTLATNEIRAVNGVAVGLSPTGDRVVSNGGAQSLPSTVPAPAGTATAPILLSNNSTCQVTGLRFGVANAPGEVAVTRPWFCGALPSVDRRFLPAANTLEDGLLAASLADPRHRIVSPSKGTKGYGLVSQYLHTHLNLEYKFGESGFTLASLTGLNAGFYSELADLDNIDTSLVNNTSLSTTGAGRRTSWDFPFLVERETYDFSQELRLTYDNEGPFTGVLGASYLKTSIWADLVNVQAEVLNAGGPSNCVLFNTNGNSNRDCYTNGVGKTPIETNGVFFGANYQFTDDLKLSVEGRYQRDNVKGLANSIGATVGPAAAAAFGIAAGMYPGLSPIVEKTYSNFLPRVIVQYDFNDDLMGYASYSKGVNVGAGTFNTNFLSLNQVGIDAAVALGLKVVQEPEKITNYEVGLKGRFLDGRLTLQSAAYLAKWTDQLNSAATTYLNGVTPTQVSGFLNTGEVELRGLEVELLAKPTAQLDVNFAASMNDSSLKSFRNNQISQITGVIGSGFEGKQLPSSSKLSANAGVQYTAPIAALDEGRWFARADLSWKDKIFLDASNTSWIKARTVVNLRAGVSRGDLGFEVYALNAFNDENPVSVAVGGVLIPGFPFQAPSGLLLGLPELRTVGARLNYKF